MGSPTLLAPFDLIEVPQRGPSRSYAFAERREPLGVDLPERMLHAEVREVEVLLVDDRRDPRVDLDHVLADELDVEEVLDPELCDDQVSGAHELVVVERLEVHRQARAHRFARLRMTEDDLATVADPVDRALAADGELHHEQIRAAFVRQELDRLLELLPDEGGPD